jgi:hypothetical protein
MNRRTLRAVVFNRAAGVCDWPGCEQRPTQLAHLHSRGFGGRASADVPSNCAALCDLHALISDGLAPNMAEYRSQVRRLPGLGDFNEAEPGNAWRIAEALKEVIDG